MTTYLPDARYRVEDVGVLNEAAPPLDHRLLLELGRAVSGSLDLGVVLERSLAAVRRVVDIRGGSIALVDEEHLRIVVAHPPVGPEVAALRLPVGRGLSGRVAETARSIYSPDIRSDERVDPNVRNMDSNSPIRSYLAVPVVAGGAVVGVLQVDSADADAFSPGQREMVAALAPLIGSAIQNARAFEAEMEERARAQELAELRRDFVDIVSHELRTPLTPLIGFAELLAADPERVRAAVDLDDVVARIDLAVGRLTGLVEELERVATADAEQLEPRLEPVDVAPVAAAATEGLDAQRVVLRVGSGCLVRADPERLRDAFRALLDNALEFSPAPAPVTLATTRSGTQIEISVDDQGPGVPGSMAERIFERFAQIEDPSTREHPGLGVGLPVARSLVERMGGTLEVVAGDHGRFVITLPAADGPGR